jgi:hypothetical protein
MKKFFYLITLVGSLAFGQEDVPYEMLGIWANMDGELLTVNRDLDDITFIRKTKTKIEATGTIEMQEGQLRIIRRDKRDEYDLAFFIGKETMVITKPRSTRAWIWFRVQ